MQINMEIINMQKNMDSLSLVALVVVGQNAVESMTHSIGTLIVHNHSADPVKSG